MDEKVSIIIPAYNAENYISRGIESCINQTYPNIEILIIDDGSTDNTWTVINDYAKKDSRIVPIKQDNHGVSSARNNGLRSAKGKYVTFIDSDDWIEENAIDSLLNIKKYDKEKVLISASRSYWNIENNQLYKMNTYSMKENYLSKDKAIKTFNTDQYLLISCYFKLFSMDIIRKNNIYFEEDIYHGEDGLFVYEYISKIEGIFFSPKPLYNYLHHNDSVTKCGYNKKLLTAISAVDRMIEYYNPSIDIENYLKSYKSERTLMVAFSAIKSMPIPKNEFKFIKKQLRNSYKDYFYLKRTLRQFLYCTGMTFLPSSILKLAFKILKL